MIPYERNAWNNQDGIQEIAQSIDDFGFRGQIKLWRKDNPVIVSGHHRIAACKQLGWTEFPDEHICWCEDMTEDDVKAFRLADNRTGQGGKWNRGLVKSEVASLGGKVDMLRYGFDFKGVVKPYGAERLRTNDAYNLQVVNVDHCSGKFGMPTIEACARKPRSLMAFNYAMTASDFDYGVHFFIDDYQFERLWNKPERYLELLKKFECVLTPDFSLYMDMPVPMQQWNEYRRRALGNWWQRNGMKVIPTLSWSVPESYGFCFDGLPKHATVAVSTIGVKNDNAATSIWNDGMTEAMRRLHPRRVLLYGGNIGFDFGGAEVVEYKANTAFTEGKHGR